MSASAPKPDRNLALELVPGREVWLSAKATAVSRYAARR